MSDEIVLSSKEIKDITHYERTADQLRFLRKMGIPAEHRTHDNTVCVLRMHVTVPAGAAGPSANDGPQRKSARK